MKPEEKPGEGFKGTFETMRDYVFSYCEEFLDGDWTIKGSEPANTNDEIYLVQNQNGRYKRLHIYIFQGRYYADEINSRQLIELRKLRSNE